MIRHIARIANTAREHDLGYGFPLTRVFEHFGVDLQKRVEAQVIDEIDSSTLMGCGLTWFKARIQVPNRGYKYPLLLLPAVLPGPSVEALQQEQLRMQAELTTVKGVLTEEKELSAKRHEDLLAILAVLTAKLSPPAP